MTTRNIYKGALRTEATHLKSENKIITDAPVDNQGKGEAFSPTDLVCAALSSCMLTIMGIEAEKEGVDMEGMQAEVYKVMSPSPRKISKIRIRISHPALKATQEQKDHLKHKARTCPVALSLSDQIIQEVEFDF